MPGRAQNQGAWHQIQHYLLRAHARRPDAGVRRAAVVRLARGRLPVASTTSSRRRCVDAALGAHSERTCVVPSTDEARQASSRTIQDGKTMLIEVKVPQLSESVAEATLLSWHKKAGRAVNRDENLIDIETDKVVLELPAPADRRHHQDPQGRRRHGGLGRGDRDHRHRGERRRPPRPAAEQRRAAPAGRSAVAPKTAPPARPRLMPAARKMAEENRRRHRRLSPARARRPHHQGRRRRSTGRRQGRAGAGAGSARGAAGAPAALPPVPAPVKSSSCSATGPSSACRCPGCARASPSAWCSRSRPPRS